MTAEGLLCDAWLAHAAAEPEREAVVHWTAGAEPHRWTWRALLARAGFFARRLREAGVRRGEVCALIVRHHPELHPLYLGVSFLGATPAVLAHPNPRVHPDKFRHGLEGMARKSGLDWILTEPELVPVLEPLLAAARSVRGVLTPLEGPLGAESPPRPDARPDDPCLLQHSSGTTGLQKAVVLSHRAVLEHVRRYGAAIALAREDRIVSWLPLYHDMGLIAALHLPLATGVPVVQLDPFEWVQAPSILLEAIARERGTLSWLPNFAYNLLADRVKDEDLEGVSLESIRLIVNCSEPVRHESHERFRARFARHGLRAGVLGACYAMAETTFAVSQTRPGAEARVLHLDREALQAGRVVPTADPARARACVSSGRPIEGCSVRVLGPAREPVAPDRTGELWIASRSLFSGYRNDPEATARVRDGEWYASGDLGFVREGEVFVIGRQKELIIQAGRNLYPEDIEDAVAQVPGILKGRVVAFGRDDEAAGTEEVCVVAETETEDRRALRRSVLEAAAQVGVSVGRVYVAPPRWLVKSTSGKLSRAQNAARALRELEWL